MKTKPKYYILSIDGGGLKGLIAIKILEAITDVLGETLTEQFDFFAGTSTGGLIVSALNTHENGRALYNLSHIEELYLQVGEKLLAKGNFFITEKETAIFDKLLHNTFQSLKLSETLRPIFVPTFDKTNNKVVVFKTRAAKQNPLKDLSLFDVCRATSAIPPVFPPYTVKYNGEKIDCVDAGIYFLKNPALAALAEVWKHKAYYASESLCEEDIVLLSISTGNFATGKNHWSEDITEIYSQHGVDVQYILDQKLKIDFKKINYLRVDLNLGAASFSVAQLVEWMNRIEEMSANREFKNVLKKLVA